MMPTSPVSRRRAVSTDCPMIFAASRVCKPLASRSSRRTLPMYHLVTIGVDGFAMGDILHLCADTEQCSCLSISAISNYLRVVLDANKFGMRSYGYRRSLAAHPPATGGPSGTQESTER